LDATAVALVLASALTHAWWNLLAKRAGAGHVFFGLVQCAQFVLSLPIFVYVARGYEWPARTVLYVLGGAALVGLNQVSLTGAYQRLDLGVAYPIGRSSALFLPLIAYLLLDETIDAVGWTALVLVAIGVLIVPHRPSAAERRPFDLLGFGFALLAAITLAAYTVWDKWVVQELDPLVYLFCYNTVIAVGYAPVLVRAQRAGTLGGEWRAHRGAAVQVAALNAFGYALVLFALTLAKATYVGALRQTSLVAGALLGCALLKEPLSPSRALGIALIVAGSALATVAG
jgi:drug/metabolite transporter (DMT)-like permease